MFTYLASLSVGNIGDYTQTPFRELGGSTGLLGILIELSLIFASIFFLIFFIIGGVQWLTSGGDKQALEGARGRITSAIIGLVIVLASFAIIRLLEAALGFRILSGFTLTGP